LYGYHDVPRYGPAALWVLYTLISQDWPPKYTRNCNEKI
jgi:hypothetical protein